MKEDIKEILYSSEEIAQRVKELGETIKTDYKGKEPFCICILKGAVVFMVDLIRAIDMPLTMDFMDISTYGNGETVESTGEVKIIKDLECAVHDKDILIVEDIFDTGLTLEYLIKLLKNRGAKSIKVCCLLSKKREDKNKKRVDIDYLGFEIPDAFVVGYGLDYAQKYRNLPYIGVLSEKVYM